MYGLPKHYRLLKTEDFSSVFALRRVHNGRWLQIWRMPNDLAHPRLGLVVSKKIAKRANKRNYMKRLLREWFRLHRSQLQAEDWVIRVRAPFDAQSRLAVCAELAGWAGRAE